jgi:hypothetical protein
MTRRQQASRVLAGLVFLTVFGCRQNPWENGIPPSSAYQSRPAKQTSTESNEVLMRKVLALQDKLAHNPRDATLVAALLKASFDASSGCFFVVGKGVANPSHPQGAWDASRKTAARFTGQRWALYLKAWRNGDQRHFGEQIAGEIAYSSSVHEELAGDTLYQLIMIPLGSIVLR